MVFNNKYIKYNALDEFGKYLKNNALSLSLHLLHPHSIYSQAFFFLLHLQVEFLFSKHLLFTMLLPSAPL